MLKISIFLCFFYIINVNSQNQNNSKSNTYDFEKFEKEKIDSTVSLYKNQQSKIWLNLLPSLNYDMRNQSVNVGISLNSFAGFYQQKQRNKIELAKYEHSLNEKLNRDLENLQLKIENFQIDFTVLKNSINLFQIDYDLFQISTGKYKNNEITSEEFLKLKLAFLQKQNSLKTNVLRLQLRLKQISIKTKNDFLEKSFFSLLTQLNNYDKK